MLSFHVLNCPTWPLHAPGARKRPLRHPAPKGPRHQPPGPTPFEPTAQGPCADRSLSTMLQDEQKKVEKENRDTRAVSAAATRTLAGRGGGRGPVPGRGGPVPGRGRGGKCLPASAPCSTSLLNSGAA